MPIGKFMGGNSIDTAIPKINIQQQQKLNYKTKTKKSKI